MLVILISLDFYTTDTFKDGFWGGILVEAHGMFMDIILFGILLTIYEKFTEKHNEIKRFNEEIDDYRGWNEPEAMYRIVGNIKRLNKYKFNKIDLTNCYLCEAYLNDIDLSGTNLAGAIFDNSRLIYCTFENSDLRFSSFKFSELDTIDCKNTNFSGTDFSNSFLINIDMSQAMLFTTDFSDSALWGVNFTNALLKDTNFKNAAFMRTIFSKEIELELLKKILNVADSKYVFEFIENEKEIIVYTDRTDNNKKVNPKYETYFKNSTKFNNINHGNN